MRDDPEQLTRYIRGFEMCMDGVEVALSPVRVPAVCTVQSVNLLRRTTECTKNVYAFTFWPHPLMPFSRAQAMGTFTRLRYGTTGVAASLQAGRQLLIGDGSCHSTTHVQHVHMPLYTVYEDARLVSPAACSLAAAHTSVPAIPSVAPPSKTNDRDDARLPYDAETVAMDGAPPAPAAPPPSVTDVELWGLSLKWSLSTRAALFRLFEDIAEGTDRRAEYDFKPFSTFSAVRAHVEGALSRFMVATSSMHVAVWAGACASTGAPLLRAAALHETLRTAVLAGMRDDTQFRHVGTLFLDAKLLGSAASQTVPATASPAVGTGGIQVTMRVNMFGIQLALMDASSRTCVVLVSTHAEYVSARALVSTSVASGNLRRRYVLDAHNLRAFLNPQQLRGSDDVLWCDNVYPYASYAAAHGMSATSTEAPSDSVPPSPRLPLVRVVNECCVRWVSSQYTASPANRDAEKSVNSFAMPTISCSASAQQFLMFRTCVQRVLFASVPDEPHAQIVARRRILQRVWTPLPPTAAVILLAKQHALDRSSCPTLVVDADAGVCAFAPLNACAPSPLVEALTPLSASWVQLGTNDVQHMLTEMLRTMPSFDAASSLPSATSASLEAHLSSKSRRARARNVTRAERTLRSLLQDRVQSLVDMPPTQPSPPSTDVDLPPPVTPAAAIPSVCISVACVDTYAVWRHAPVFPAPPTKRVRVLEYGIGRLCWQLCKPSSGASSHSTQPVAQLTLSCFRGEHEDYPDESSRVELDVGAARLVELDPAFMDASVATSSMFTDQPVIAKRVMLSVDLVGRDLTPNDRLLRCVAVTRPPLRPVTVADFVPSSRMYASIVACGYDPVTFAAQQVVVYDHLEVSVLPGAEHMINVDITRDGMDFLILYITAKHVDDVARAPPSTPAAVRSDSAAASHVTSVRASPAGAMALRTGPDPSPMSLHPARTTASRASAVPDIDENALSSLDSVSEMDSASAREDSMSDGGGDSPRRTPEAADDAAAAAVAPTNVAARGRTVGIAEQSAQFGLRPATSMGLFPRFIKSASKALRAPRSLLRRRQADIRPLTTAAVAAAPAVPSLPAEAPALGGERCSHILVPYTRLSARPTRCASCGEAITAFRMKLFKCTRCGVRVHVGECVRNLLEGAEGNAATVNELSVMNGHGVTPAVAASTPVSAILGAAAGVPAAPQVNAPLADAVTSPSASAPSAADSVPEAQQPAVAYRFFRYMRISHMAVSLHIAGYFGVRIDGVEMGLRPMTVHNALMTWDQLFDRVRRHVRAAVWSIVPRVLGNAVGARIGAGLEGVASLAMRRKRGGEDAGDDGDAHSAVAKLQLVSAALPLPRAFAWPPSLGAIMFDGALLANGGAQPSAVPDPQPVHAFTRLSDAVQRLVSRSRPSGEEQSKSELPDVVHRSRAASSAAASADDLGSDADDDDIDEDEMQDAGAPGGELDAAMDTPFSPPNATRAAALMGLRSPVLMPAPSPHTSTLVSSMRQRFMSTREPVGRPPKPPGVAHNRTASAFVTEPVTPVAHPGGRFNRITSLFRRRPRIAAAAEDGETPLATATGVDSDTDHADDAGSVIIADGGSVVLAHSPRIEDDGLSSDASRDGIDEEAPPPTASAAAVYDLLQSSDEEQPGRHPRAPIDGLVARLPLRRDWR